MPMKPCEQRALTVALEVRGPESLTSAAKPSLQQRVTQFVADEAPAAPSLGRTRGKRAWLPSAKAGALWPLFVPVAAGQRGLSTVLSLSLSPFLST